MRLFSQYADHERNYKPVNDMFFTHFVLGYLTSYNILVLHIGGLRGRTHSENKYFPTKIWWTLSIKYGRDYLTSKASNGDWIDKPGKLSTGNPNMKRMHLARV